MPSVLANAVVRLQEDDPTHALKRGTEGVVVCVWPSSNGLLCEVEFPSPGKSPAIRALLRSQQLEVVELQPARGLQ
jgi:hypothetical protein